MAPEVARAVAAIQAGEVVIIATDTVYGLAADGLRPEPVARLYRLKGRLPEQPSALIAASVDVVLECLPELHGATERVLRALLPRPLTLVVPNPARRLPWLTGTRPDAIGIRVPELGGAAGHILQAVGAVAATSANLPGGDDPHTLGDVPLELSEGAAAVVDGGRLPGVASTVIDLTREAPLILREGALGAEVALELVRIASAIR